MKTETERLQEAGYLVAQALSYVDSVVMSVQTDVSYETFQRSGFRRPGGWRRKYTLADARPEARQAAKLLREAWELLDPTIVKIK